MIKKKKCPNLSQLKKLQDLQAYMKIHFVGLAMNRRSHAIKHLPDKEDLINIIWKKCVILFLLIKNQPKQILSTLELVPKNNWMTFLDKLLTFNHPIENTFHIQLYQILVQELISNVKDFKPFWTPVYKKLSEKLLLPTETDFPDLVSNLLNVSLKKQVVPSKYLTMTYTKAQNKNLQKTCYQLSTSTVVNKWVNENTQKRVKLKNLKIQIYPSLSQKKILDKWIKTSHYVYNKTVAAINSGEKKNFITLRDKLVTNETRKTDVNYERLTNLIKILNKQISEIDSKNEYLLKDLKEQLINAKNEKKQIKFQKNTYVNKWELDTPKEIRAGSVNDVIKAYDSGFSNLKAGNVKHFKLGFRKITNNKKSFVLPHSFIYNKDGNLKIAPRFFKDDSLFIMGKKTIKKYKDIQINNDCRVIHERNKYWISIPQPTILKEKPTPINYCGIDPGVRTFLTSFEKDGVMEYNQPKDIIKKLNKKIDLLNRLRTSKRNKYKIEERKENIINEVHWKSINSILKRNDFVFYGDIKSHDIVKKNANKYLNRNMNDLKFYKFKQRLIYKANILNKQVFNVNEKYTTMTCSSCGKLNNVGKNEIYNCGNQLCNKTLLRDVSAAKNILMKGIIKHL